MLCPQCQYPQISTVCDNPACPQDKPESQLVLIRAAWKAQKAKDAYSKRNRIDYSLSFKKRV